MKESVMVKGSVIQPVLFGSDLLVATPSGIVNLGVVEKVHGNISGTPIYETANFLYVVKE